jgi:hypothetical protein
MLDDEGLWQEQLGSMMLLQEVNERCNEGFLKVEAGQKLVPPAVDKVQLSYQQVTPNGKPFEGPQAGMPKHPFGLSRVYYDSKELPCSRRQAWCQMSDGSCRWRQSSSEIQLRVLQVTGS